MSLLEKCNSKGAYVQFSFSLRKCPLVFTSTGMVISVLFSLLYESTRELFFGISFLSFNKLRRFPLRVICITSSASNKPFTGDCWSDADAVCAAVVITTKKSKPPFVRYKLAKQFAASKVNAVLVLAETTKDGPDSYGGKLEQPDVFKNLVNDVLIKLKKEKIISKRCEAGNITLPGHSGAYVGVASTKWLATVSQVRCVWQAVWTVMVLVWPCSHFPRIQWVRNRH